MFFSSGEQALDDGGPRRELFPGKLQHYYFVVIVMDIWHKDKSMYAVGVLFTSLEKNVIIYIV